MRVAPKAEKSLIVGVVFNNAGDTALLMEIIDILGDNGIEQPYLLESTQPFMG